MIPVAIPDLSGNEERYVLEAIQSTWISSSGAFLDRFEKEFAHTCQTDNCLAVANGTVALHLALLALDVQPGDEVLVPSLTYIATANAVRYMGAIPVFVDVEPETWCIDPARLEDAITPRTRGIIPVHLYGHPADMDSINQVASKHGLWVIEDAAEAHLAEYKGRRVGSLSTIATFSFFGNKVFTCGEGGALTFSDEALLERARTLRGQGVDPKQRYVHPVVGYNYRLTNVAAAILCAQIERAEEILKRRLEIFEAYEKHLSGLPGIEFQPVAPWAKRTPWLFCFTVDESKCGATRDQLADHLREHDVDTRPFFLGLHQQLPYQEFAAAQKVHLPQTERLSAIGLNLPTYSSLTDKQIKMICDVIAERVRLGS
jgi:perosamine synthetase